MRKSQIHLLVEGDDELIAAFKHRQPGDAITLRSVECELLENTEKDVVLEVKKVEVDVPAEADDGGQKADDGAEDDDEVGDAVSRAMGRSS